MTNPPGRRAAAPYHRGGRGLRGAAERATLLGGRLEAGPHRGRWRLRAVLPLGAGPDDPGSARRRCASCSPTTSGWSAPPCGSSSKRNPIWRSSARRPPAPRPCRWSAPCAPDVVLMDVRMPEIDGIRATEQIIATLAEPPRIVVVTTFENDAYVYDALRAGAAGFLLKRAEPDELIGAVRLVARGDSLLFPAAVRALAASHAPGAGAPPPPGWRGSPTGRPTYCA